MGEEDKRGEGSEGGKGSYDVAEVGPLLLLLLLLARGHETSFADAPEGAAESAYVGAL